MSDHSGASATGRDLRLDFFRGLALFCIFIDHIPNNFFSLFTVQSLGLSDAAEMFILISGFTAGLVFGRALETRGPLAAGTRIYHRVWQLYVAHIFLFMLYMGLVAHTMGTLNNPIYAEELRAADFLREPDVAIVMAMTLRFQPVFLDILPLYIVLLAALPLMLALFRVAGAVALALSFALWLAVQITGGIALQAYPGPSTWFFNPFAWQFLFFIGAYFGWRGVPGDDRWRPHRWVVTAALAITIAAFVVRLSWAAHAFYDPLPAILPGLRGALVDKSDLAVPRLLNILALAIVAMRFIGPRDRWLTGRIAAPFILCGRHSLHIFCLGILLSVLGHLILNEYFGGIPMQAMVTAGGIAIMIGVAALMDWFRASQAAPSTARGGRRVAVLVFAAVLLGGLGGTHPAPAADPACPVPDDAYEFEPVLPRTLEALQSGKEVTIVALGGASTEGRAAGGGENAWPARMAASLKDRFPQAKIAVRNLSVARQTTAEMAKRIERDVAPLDPTFVIWETGTTDAVRGIDPSAFRADLEEGIARLQSAGTEIVLMDMQYSRMTHAVIHFNPYAEAMRDVADVHDVALFPRHEIMRDWAESGLLDGAERTPEARRALAEKLYRCLGSAVADFIVRQPDDPPAETK